MTPALFALPQATLASSRYARFSPLMLSDRLITLAKEADLAGYRNSAERLIGLAYAVLDDEGPCASSFAA